MASRALLEVHDYSSEQEKQLVIINIICSSISFIGALFIGFNYLMFPQFKENYAFKLIFMVAVGDMISCIGNFFVNPEDNDLLCVIQGILAEAGALASICWVTAISFSIYHVISLSAPPTIEDTTKWLKIMHICIWSYIFICTILPLTTNSYGPAGGWCWIKGKTDQDNVWRFILFYVPVWLAIIFMIFVYCKVWNRLNATIQQSGLTESLINEQDDDDDDDVSIDATGDNNINIKKKDNSSQSTTLQRMKYYPMILIICYLPASIRRLSELLSGDDVSSPFFLAALQVFFSALTGFGNAMVYGWSLKAVRDKDILWIKTICGCNSDDNVVVNFEHEEQDVALE